MFWNNEKETGHESPVRLVITEGAVVLADITAETAEEAATTLLCLLEQAHRRYREDDDPIAVGVRAAAETLNDAVILWRETETPPYGDPS